MSEYVIPAKDWLAELQEAVQNAEDGDTIVVQSDAKRKLGQAMCPEKALRFEVRDTDRPHLSPTRLDMIVRCGEQYRRQYVEGERRPPRLAKIRGKSVHGGAEVNFRQKVESFADLPVSDIVDASVAHFSGELQSAFELDPDQRSKGIKKAVGETKDAVARLAQVHAEKQSPKYQPVHVEQAVRIELKDQTHDILSVIDCAARPAADPEDGELGIVDVKTSGRRKSQHEADHSVQLTTYAAALSILEGTGTDVPVSLEVCLDQKSAGSQTLTSTRGAADYVALGRRVSAALRVIESGDFLPAPVGAWWCSPDWCGYWSDCPFVNSQRKAKQ